MTESGFAVPSYVGVKNASNEGTTTDNPNDININSQENVWLSAIKLACMDVLPTIRDSYAKKVVDAARRYGILGDIKAAAAFVDRLDVDPQQIRTEGDWKRSKEWLHKNAEHMDLHIREGIVDHLFEKAAELGYTPSLSEKCLLHQIAEREPITHEIQKLAEESIHRLATGTHYTTDQFKALPFDEVKDILPDLVKSASFEMSTLHPALFARAATAVEENTAVVLDALLQKHGQFPVYDDSNLPIEINDAMLAAL